MCAFRRNRRAGSHPAATPQRDNQVQSVFSVELEGRSPFGLHFCCLITRSQAMERINDPPPERNGDIKERIQKVIDFWNAFSVGGDSGETTWAELETIQAQVT